MIQFARGLSETVLGALAELERRTLAVDGGRLKLEWSVLKARTGRDVEDVLWWEEDRLLGFVGIYAFGPPTVELAGMVDPAGRRRGIATALLDAALPLCRERGYSQALLVTPGVSDAGRCFALHRGAVLEHSEHALVLVGDPADSPANPELTLRPATVADVDVIRELLGAAFGSAPSDLLERLQTETSRTLVVTLAGRAVGTVRLERGDDSGAVYGFAVDPAWQGKGIGRDVLRRVCLQLREEGARQIRLEVAVQNARALGLYTSIGFAEGTTEDYYALSVT